MEFNRSVFVTLLALSLACLAAGSKNKVDRSSPAPSEDPKYDVELEGRDIRENKVKHVYSRCINDSHATLTFDDGIDP
jgi:hypothetical protein